jgi:hypothetical protein
LPSIKLFSAKSNFEGIRFLLFKIKDFLSPPEGDILGFAGMLGRTLFLPKAA